MKVKNPTLGRLAPKPPAWRRSAFDYRSREEAVAALSSQAVAGIPIPARLKPFTPAHFAAFARHLELDSGQPWRPEAFQLDFLGDVFAGKPECWLVVPEGNGKTTLIAGLALYVCEFSKQAIEIPVAASAMEQARILYRQAEGFVLRSPALHQMVFSAIQEVKGKLKLEVPRFSVLPGLRRIEHYRGSRLQVVAADDRTGDGVIFALAILDELHRHRTLDLYRTWVGKRHKVGGQVVTISTAGEPGSEFELTRTRIRQEATAIERRPGFVKASSDEVALHEWSMGEDADVEDLGLVKECNPLSQITVKMLSSKRRSPTMTLQHWRRFTCNLPTRGDNAAIQEAEWFAAATTEEIPVGQPIWLGLDVAWKWDTTAAVPFWMKDSEHRLLGPACVLSPPRDGTSMDPVLVERMLAEIHQRNPLHTVVMDLERAEQLGTWIEHQFGATVIDRGQGNAEAIQDYERFMEAFRSGWLKHSGDQALTSHAFNAIARIMIDGRARFDRTSQTRMSINQDRRVIDALSAAAMVHSVAADELANQYALLESVY